MGSGTVPEQHGIWRVIDHPSPNFGQRRGGLRPDMIVLHGTAMESAVAALERLCSEEFEVSAHYLIAGCGKIYRMVDEERRAWHAGAGSWGGLTDINSRSIGIELDNAPGIPFTDPQMGALDTLLSEVMKRWSIPAERVIAHSDMAPRRKVDPGPKFDWRRLALAGLSVWPEEEPDTVGGQPGRTVGEIDNEVAFRSAALAFGYPDEDADLLLTAFRLRFRPRSEGPLSEIDLAMMRNLADGYPVDRGPRDA